MMWFPGRGWASYPSQGSICQWPPCWFQIQGGTACNVFPGAPGVHLRWSVTKVRNKNKAIGNSFLFTTFPTRVISTVYQTEDTEMTNRWRVTDYSADGRVLMSVLCRFLKTSAKGAKRKTTASRARLHWGSASGFNIKWSMSNTSKPEQSGK